MTETTKPTVSSLDGRFTAHALSRQWRFHSSTAVPGGKEDEYRNALNHRCWVCYSGGSGPTLKLARGLPQHPQPDIWEMDEKSLNKYFLRARRFCFLCGTNENIGVALAVKAADISEQERELQSARDRGISQTDDSRPSVGSAGEEGERGETYSPYPKCPAPSASVTPDTRPSRLVIDLVPVYVCVHCRRMGEGGTHSVEPVHPCFPANVTVPSPRQRNVINKYTQANVCTIRFIDQHSGVFPITDRLSVITNERTLLSTVQEQCLLSQLELLAEKKANAPNEELWQLKQGCLATVRADTVEGNPFTRRLAPLVAKAIPTLLRAAAKLSTKVSGENELRDMNEFEQTYEFSLVIIRAALHLIHHYPAVKHHLQTMVLRWNFNPFGQPAKSLFQHWMDVVWLAALLNLPFALIRRSIIARLFHEMLLNFPALPDTMPEPQTPTYLRRLFNEGRSRNTARQLLYTMAFSGMIRDLLGRHGWAGTIALMDDHECYLPEENLKQVWREMQYVNTHVVSLEPLQHHATHGFLPGLFLHLGMGSPEADAPTTSRHILRFLELVRGAYNRLSSQVVISPEIESQIANVQLNVPRAVAEATQTAVQQQVSSVSRHQELSRREDERRAEFRRKHQGEPVLSKDQIAQGRFHRLNSFKCAYPECGATFTSSRQLKAHLSEAWELEIDDPLFNQAEIHRWAFRQGSEFWRDHKNDANHPWAGVPLVPSDWEIPVSSEHIPPWKCPVPLCRAGDFSRPELLRDHLAQYGVHPWFSPDWKPFDPDSEMEVAVDDDDSMMDPASPSPAASSSTTTPVTQQAEDAFKMKGDPWDDPATCVVCLENQVTEVLVECGHVCMCPDCCDKWLARSPALCPICRAPVISRCPVVGYRGAVFQV